MEMKLLRFGILAALLVTLPCSVHGDDGDAPSGVAINATNFPDNNFRDYVVTYDTDNDGELSDSEIKAAKWISVREKDISSLKGVEYFTAAKYLDCDANQLTSLDISKNTELTILFCDDNELTALDVSKNTALSALSCSSNQLTALDVSKNAALKELSCSENQLTSLDVSKNAALTGLFCSGNQLTALDVSNNPALNNLYCNNNIITSLDVSKNTALTELGCSSNQLTALDVSRNTALTYLSCGYNQIKESAMSQLVNSLNSLTGKEKNFMVVGHNNTDGNICTNTQVAVAVSKGWTVRNEIWNIYEGTIVINATNFPDENFHSYLLKQNYGRDGVLTEKEIKEVTTFNVSHSNIKSLKGIEFFKALTHLDCDDNQLTSLDLSKNTALTHLNCDDNLLTSLDLAKNTALKWVYCSDNQLTDLDVSKNFALIELKCATNQLSSLDVSKNEALVALQCNNNNIKGSAMDALVNSLNDLDVMKPFMIVSLDDDTEGNVCTKSQAAVAKRKRWSVYDSNWDDYEGSNDETTSLPNTVTSPCAGKTTLYDLQGHPVRKPATKGIYIKSGKKITIKCSSGLQDAQDSQ